MNKIKKRIIQFISFSTIFFGIAVTTSAAQAISIGVSPSELFIEVEQGARVTKELVLSRSETEGVHTFDVSARGDDPIIEPSFSSVEILEGEQTVSYNVAVDAENLDIGEYNDEVITFVLRTEQEDPVGQVMKFGLSVKIHIEVVPVGTLSAEDYTSNGLVIDTGEIEEAQVSTSKTAFFRSLIYPELKWYTYLLLAVLLLSICGIAAAYFTYLRRSSKRH